ncbi:hypothetical protein [Bradyrhizobium sp. 2TAF24]
MQNYRSKKNAAAIRIIAATAMTCANNPPLMVRMGIVPPRTGRIKPMPRD